MTRAKPQSESCAECRGLQYRLSNSKGLLHGERCSCFACEVCGGRGQIFEESESGVSTIRECACAVLTKRLAKLNEAGIPGKFAESDIASYKCGKGFHPSLAFAKEIATHFVKDFPHGERPGLLFMGRPGLGKTHLAVSVIKALILEGGANCKFVDFFQLLSDIRYGYSQDLSEQAIINPYVHAQVLVVDELAKGRNTEWELTMLDQIISSRYNAADKITLFTTNYMDVLSGPEQKEDESKHTDTRSKAFGKSVVGEETLQEKIGERIFSRLVEMCRTVKLEGEDYRQKEFSKHRTTPHARKR